MKKNILLTVLFFTFLFAQAQQTQIIAHRGYWKTVNNAQNSITALTMAGSENFYGSELDIYITKDNVLIVNHDPEINGLSIETNLYAAFANTELKNREPLPTLETYLKAGKKFPNLKLILEIKPHKNTKREAKAVKEVLKLVANAKLEDRVEYISFSQNICNEIKKQNPKALVSYLNGDLTPEQVKQNGWNGIDYHYTIFQKNPSWIERAHNLGLLTNTWTVNDTEIMDEMILSKIQYISTDEPLILKEKLLKREPVKR